MLKLNTKGFALVETLIVSVFVMGLFTLMYTNFYPLMGEYEKRENYDDIGSLYNTYMLKRALENNNYTKSAEEFLKFECKMTVDKTYCDKLVEKSNLHVAIVTPYKIDIVKSRIDYLDSKLSGVEDLESFKEYILSLPDYNNNPQTLGSRIIAMYKDDSNAESGNNAKPIYKFATIGVK